VKNSEECEFKGLTFDEHQVAMRKGPQSLMGLRPTCFSKVSFEYLNGGLNFGKYRLRHRCVLSFFLSPPRNYSVYSIKNGPENGSRGISELESLVSTLWKHKSFYLRTPIKFEVTRRFARAGEVISTGQ